jgi:hypothetical protein
VIAAMDAVQGAVASVNPIQRVIAAMDAVQGAVASVNPRSNRQQGSVGRRLIGLHK